jgi:ectoine hydroxylase-related dioxygenase (phytanoyl-CoA dioxygenase family)
MDGAAGRTANGTIAASGAYGIRERLPQRDLLDEAAAELAINGYTVIDSGLGAGELSDMRKALDAVYRRQVREIGGVAALDAIDDADVARCPLAYDERFLELATHRELLALLRRVLGPDIVLLMQNGILNRPGRAHAQRRWHRDLNYQHWTSSKPIALSALLCVDDFTARNGASFVLPGTQHVAAFPTERFVRAHERQLTAKAGSFLVFDAMLFHRGGTNTSGRLRRAINHVVGLPFLAQAIDLPTALERAGCRPPADESIRRYLGYRWAPAPDVLSWRRARMPAVHQA